MLKSFDVKYCLVGHSERRLIFKETDEDINNKIRTILNQSIKPILCIGENTRTKNENCTSFKIKNKLFDQLSNAFKNNQPEEMKEVILTYEPV
jgi:triosephosphate isomerase